LSIITFLFITLYSMSNKKHQEKTEKIIKSNLLKKQNLTRQTGLIYLFV